MRITYPAVSEPKILSVMDDIMYDVIRAKGSKPCAASRIIESLYNSLYTTMTYSRNALSRIFAMLVSLLWLQFLCQSCGFSGSASITKGAFSVFRPTASTLSFATGVSQYVLPFNNSSSDIAAPNGDVIFKCSSFFGAL